MKIKGMRKKLNIFVVLVFVLSCAFSSLTSSAVEWSVYPNHIGTWTASYELDYPTDPDSGTVTMTYESQRTISTAVYYVFSGAPFNYGGADTDGDGEKDTGYSLTVNMRNIPVNQLDSSDNMYWIRFRFAIGTRNQIYTMPSTTYVELIGSDGLVQQELKNKIEGNVCYVEDSFSHVIPGALNVRIRFLFGRELGSDMSWSNSDRFWITQIFYGRNDDIGDVKDAIDNQTDSILNETGDGSITDNTNSLNSNIDNYNKQRDEFDEFINSIGGSDKVNGYNPDGVDRLSPSFTFLGTAFSGIVSAFGADFDTLWWVLVSLGVCGACFGVVAYLFRRFRN